MKATLHPGLVLGNYIVRFPGGSLTFTGPSAQEDAGRFARSWNLDTGTLSPESLEVTLDRAKGWLRWALDRVPADVRESWQYRQAEEVAK